MESKNVNILKSPSDFTEMLSLSELNTQMKVLEFLQKNMLEYQRDYVRSFIKTKEEVLSFIPNSDIETYFPPYFSYRDSQKFIIDTKNKSLIKIDDEFIDTFKFKCDNEKLVCEYSKTNRKASENNRRIILEEIVYYKLVFDMGTNVLIDYAHNFGIYQPIGDNGFFKKR